MSYADLFGNVGSWNPANATDCARLVRLDTGLGRVLRIELMQWVTDTFPHELHAHPSLGAFFLQRTSSRIAALRRTLALEASNRTLTQYFDSLVERCYVKKMLPLSDGSALQPRGDERGPPAADASGGKNSNRNAPTQATPSATAKSTTDGALSSSPDPTQRSDQSRSTEKGGADAPVSERPFVVPYATRCSAV